MKLASHYAKKFIIFTLSTLFLGGIESTGKIKSVGCMICVHIELVVLKLLL